MRNRPARGRAVVVGASIAGCLAARVAADHYDEVLIIDRDGRPVDLVPHQGTPQAHHAHGLHGLGHQNMERFYPGITDELSEQGVPVGDMAQMQWYFNGKKGVRGTSGLLSVTAPRPVLETLIRRRTLALANVRVKWGHTFSRLECDENQITGIWVSNEGDEQLLSTDLVIDTTGRGSRLPLHLTELGYPAPSESRVKIDLAYTTRIYSVPSDRFGGVQSYNPLAYPDFPRGAFFGLIGTDTAILSLTGIGDDKPPRDPAGFDRFVDSLPAPEIHAILKHATPLGPPRRFTFPDSIRRHYDQLKLVPGRLAVMGDALCTFNPVYGQGMAVATAEAVALDKHLRRGGSGGRELMEQLSKCVVVPWLISTSGDLDYPGSVGKRLPITGVMNKYMKVYQQAACQDGRLTGSFMRVAALVDSPTQLMTPRTLWRVARGNLSRAEASS